MTRYFFHNVGLTSIFLEAVYAFLYHSASSETTTVKPAPDHKPAPEKHKIEKQKPVVSSRRPPLTRHKAAAYRDTTPPHVFDWSLQDFVGTKGFYQGYNSK